MRSPKRGTAALAVAAASAVVLSLGTASAVARNPNNSTKMTEAVTVQAVHDHLEAFQLIADSHDGGRAAGTPGYVASAEYVEDKLRLAGYETTRQPFIFLYQETLTESLYAAGAGAGAATTTWSCSMHTWTASPTGRASTTTAAGPR